MDQGVHLIDLCRWMGGELSLEVGRVHTFFWDMPVEDNGFLLLRSPDQKVFAHLHASCTEWKNLFSLEIYGRTGKIAIDGLGRSYGVERLAFHRMRPEMGPPDTETWEYPGPDESWALELAAFADDIRLDREPSPGLREAIRTLEIVEAVYRRSGLSFT